MSDPWWTLIKRQTELGEYPGFEDERFSSYGPITEYHGTAFAPEIDRGGLQGNVMSRHRAVRPPADMEGKPVVYSTTDKKLAQQWAEQQTKRQNKFGKDKRNPRVVGIRGQGLDYTPDPKQDAKSSFQQGEVRVRTPNIPRERLVVRKEAKSPKALAHKRKYETRYESSPARKKYRRDLERERRKRGVAGKGGKDMSHTKRGTIVPEDPHTNRARSHPSVGSTLKMLVVKAPQMNLFGQSAECELCKAPMSGQEAAVSNQQFGASVCTPCIMREQEEINQANDMMFHGEPMDIAMRLLKEQKKLFVQGQKTLDGRPAFMPTDFAAEEQRRQAALKEAEAKKQRMIAVQQHEAMSNQERNDAFQAKQLNQKQAREAQRRKKAEGLTPLPHFQQNSE